MAEYQTDTTETRYSIDYRKMVAEAEAAGFNPLTAIRSGGSAGFGVVSQTHTYLPISGPEASGSFTTAPPPEPAPAPVPEAPAYVPPAPVVPEPVPNIPAPPSAPADTGFEMVYIDDFGTPPPNGSGMSVAAPIAGPVNVPGFGVEGVDWIWHNGVPQPLKAYDPEVWWWVNGGSIHDSRPGEWDLASEFNIAMAQVRMRSGDVWTDDGRHIETRAAKVARTFANANAGGMLNPISYTAPTGAASTAMPNGFQSEQAYVPDELTNVIAGDTTHWIAPGVSWVEKGGATRGEVWETVYGELGGALMGAPKLAGDIYHNLAERPAAAAWNIGNSWLSSGFGGVFAPGWGGITSGASSGPLRIVVDGANSYGGYGR